ncbi:AraC family ligand binding domain-containing protein, partial [Aeromonas hydrophila]
MMSETANTDLVDVSPDCREQICCDSLLPALAQEQVWLAGYSRLKTRYRIARRFADVHCFLLTQGGEGEVQVGDRRERLQVGEWALIPAGEPLCYQLNEQLSEQLSEQVNEPLDQPLSETGEWELVWLLLHKDSPWDTFASYPRLGCTSQQATVLRTIENLYAEQERHQDPLLSALLVEQLGFYLRRLLQKGEGQRRGERLALRLELLLKEALTEPWDIARMAGALHLSERQLYRLCQQHFALAPMAL